VVVATLSTGWRRFIPASANRDTYLSPHRRKGVHHQRRRRLCTGLASRCCKTRCIQVPCVAGFRYELFEEMNGFIKHTNSMLGAEWGKRDAVAILWFRLFFTVP